MILISGRILFSIGRNFGLDLKLSNYQIDTLSNFTTESVCQSAGPVK